MNPERLVTIVSNDDNLAYGSVVSVYTGMDEAITALTDDGIDELRQMLAHARRSTKDWNDIVDDFDFLPDPDAIARVKARARPF